MTEANDVNDFFDENDRNDKTARRRFELAANG